MLLRLLAGTLSISATWAVLIAISIGIGLALRRAFGVKGINADGLLVSCWMGVSLTVLLLQVWHFFLPIRWPALAVMVAFGSVGFLWNAPELWGWAGRMRSQKHRGLILIPLLACFFIANHAMGPSTAYDSGMYHLPAVNWAKSFPIVPGLGNLHSRLAFNNANLLYAAMVDVGPWSGQSNHLVNGLFLLLLSLQISLRGFQLWHARGTHRALCLFDLVLFTPVALLIHKSEFISSFTIDVPTAIVLFVAASLLFAQLTGANLQYGTRERAYDLIVLTTLLTVAVCFKLSAIGFSVTAWMLAVTWWLWHDPASRSMRATALTWIALLTLVLSLSWVGRGVILSGYPAYPSPIGAVPVDWRVPTEQAEADVAWIRYYARTGLTANPSVDEHGLWRSQWVWPWLENTLVNERSLWQFTLPVLLTILLLPMTLFGRRRRALAAEHAPAGWALLLPIITGVAFWFVTAPRPVFGFFAFWILAALLAAQTVTTALSSATQRSVSVLFLTGILVCLPLAAYLGLIAIRQVNQGHNPLTELRRVLVVRPEPGLWFRRNPSPQIETFTTTSGLQLYVPQHDNRCFDAPMPCTPHPSPNLRLRRMGDLAAGFATDGPWHPLRWPNPRTSFLSSWRKSRMGITNHDPTTP